MLNEPTRAARPCHHLLPWRPQTVANPQVRERFDGDGRKVGAAAIPLLRVLRYWRIEAPDPESPMNGRTKSEEIAI
ncbi:hypothetical protein [Shinella sp. BYT-45]|uniref:hypothetical protein n=1 Tax=Shinella sp. BYT-45 TaxID=3377377 RepID=UPI00397F3EE4